MNESVLIVRAGNGLSASLTQLCASREMKAVLAARNIEKLQNLKKEIGADTSYAEDLLGLKFNPAKGCISETAKSVVRLGLV